MADNSKPDPLSDLISGLASKGFEALLKSQQRPRDEPENSVMFKIVNRLQHATMKDSSDPLDLIDALISQRNDVERERDQYADQSKNSARNAADAAAANRRAQELANLLAEVGVALHARTNTPEGIVARAKEVEVYDPADMKPDADPMAPALRDTVDAQNKEIAAQQRQLSEREAHLKRLMDALGITTTDFEQQFQETAEIADKAVEYDNAKRQDMTVNENWNARVSAPIVAPLALTEGMQDTVPPCQVITVGAMLELTVEAPTTLVASRTLDEGRMHRVAVVYDLTRATFKLKLIDVGRIESKRAEPMQFRPKTPIGGQRGNINEAPPELRDAIARVVHEGRRYGVTIWLNTMGDPEATGVMMPDDDLNDAEVVDPSFKPELRKGDFDKLVVEQGQDPRLDDVIGVLVRYLDGVRDLAGIPSQRLITNAVHELNQAREGDR